MDIPTHCRYCHGEVIPVHNSAIYGRGFGKWPYAYLCTECKAYVGVHQYTDIPLGYVADKKTREARKLAKAEFFRWLGVSKLSKSEAYSQLADRLNIAKEYCHFGMFSEAMSEKAYSWLKTKK